MSSMTKCGKGDAPAKRVSSPSCSMRAKLILSPILVSSHSPWSGRDYNAPSEALQHCPVARIPPPCRWRHSDTGSYSDWHSGCVVYVAQREGKWRVWIQSFGVRSEHLAGRRRQGVRFIERWVCARGGLPGFRSKAAAKVSQASCRPSRNSIQPSGHSAIQVAPERRSAYDARLTRIGISSGSDR